MVSYLNHKDLSNSRIEQPRAREIGDAVKRVLDDIAQAQEHAGREPGSVTLLAATKTRDVGEIMAAIDAGVRTIGENRPQEIELKAPVLRRLVQEHGFTLGQCPQAVEQPKKTFEQPVQVAESSIIPLHLIGQLQSNKIGKILPYVDTIESVDSQELAEKISRRAVARGMVVSMFLEVNESGETTKSGCAPGFAFELSRRIAMLGGIRLRGLMTVGAHLDDEATVRRGFAHLRRLRDDIKASGELGTEHCEELSMGMSGDMALAIAEGSTIVRVGTTIFGQRTFA